jgi:hypothetical protein
MKKITTKTESIINLAKQKGDNGILDLIDFIYRGNVYEWLSNEIENLSDEDKDELLDELEFDIDKTILYVDKEEFTKWYLDGFYDLEKMRSVIMKQIEREKIGLKNLIQEEEYIPIYIIKNKEDIRKEDIEKFGIGIKIPGEKYRLEWAK